ncbi:hypothetical protein RRG08_022002 [Elysia crispata]|uniref:Uncharacterized protein n=1 Tax=Elysia crispata TaxID=231223 RepID=A0AAE1DUI8_9GAST|nr:hypothetical protein RRG08_022002 [Elysia crispata]
MFSEPNQLRKCDQIDLLVRFTCDEFFFHLSLDSNLDLLQCFNNNTNTNRKLSDSNITALGEPHQSVLPYLRVCHLPLRSTVSLDELSVSHSIRPGRCLVSPGFACPTIAMVTDGDDWTISNSKWTITLYVHQPSSSHRRFGN